MKIGEYLLVRDTDMFEKYKDYKKIVVTGPQRSGTTIASHMIAKDLGYEHIDETKFGVHNGNVFRKILNDRENIVIQAPGLFQDCMAIKDEDVLVVVMKRNIKDIIASQERIKWAYEKGELSKFGLENGIISKVKYDYFKTHKPKNYVELRYSDLKRHPLYVENRKRFSPKQTQ